MFHTDYIIWEYLFSIWIGSFESRYFTLYRYIFVMSVRQRYTEFHAQVHRPRRQKAHPVCFHYFTKARFVECTQINVESLQIWKMYYSYLYDQKWWSNLRASECTGASICPSVYATVQLPHRHLNSIISNIRLSGHVMLLILAYFRR